MCRVSWVGFTAEARLAQDHDDPIRDAVAGYGAGEVVPAVAALLDAVLSVRRIDESITDALERADISRQLDDVVVAAARSRSPREIESRLIKGWTALGIASVTVQVAGVVFLLNEMAQRDLLASTERTIALVVLSGSAAVFLAATGIVRQLQRSLARAIRAGKDASGGT